MTKQQLTKEQRAALEGLRSTLTEKVDSLAREVAKQQAELAGLQGDLANVESLLGKPEDDLPPPPRSPGVPVTEDEGPRKARVSHTDVITMIAAVLQSAPGPMHIRDIYESLEEKSEQDGFQLPGQGRLNNVSVHLTNYKPDEIKPIKRMPGQGMYGLIGRD